LTGPNGVHVEFDGKAYTPTANGIRRFEDVPDIFTLDVPPVDPIVPALGINRNSIVLWTGADGDGKTYLVEAMGVEVARGGEFLGMRCQKCPVLYLDLENAAHTVQDRLRAMTGEKSLAELRVWGIWNEQQPPMAGSPLLLNICRETRPVIILDPFRYFHSAEENDSTAMAAVMQYLRACAAHGAAIIILHHPAKSEGSTGRGSSAIRGACDLAFLHSLDKESGLITLKVDKNRNGESRTITLRADFEEGKFEVTEAPFITRRNDEYARLEQIIREEPGISQNTIIKKFGGMTARCCRLLQECVGARWVTRQGPNRSKCFYLAGYFSASEKHLETLETPQEQAVGVSGVSPLKGRETPKHHTSKPCSGISSERPNGHAAAGKALPQCGACGSFDLYGEQDGKIVCQTCEARQ
jgi:hypothetical protein